jgi:endonuclease YncB( thermonuclease family)
MLVLACVVIAIQTGDMVTVKCPNQAAKTVRIAAIDAPERNQAWGEKSRTALADLCWKQLARVTPRDNDRQGRIIADVECRGRDVAQTLVRTGNAWVYDRHAREYGNLYAIEFEARKHQSGLWSQKSPVAPWDFRYRQARAAEPQKVVEATRHRATQQAVTTAGGPPLR